VSLATSTKRLSRGSIGLPQTAHLTESPINFLPNQHAANRCDSSRRRRTACPLTRRLPRFSRASRGACDGKGEESDSVGYRRSHGMRRYYMRGATTLYGSTLPAGDCARSVRNAPLCCPDLLDGRHGRLLARLAVPGDLRSVDCLLHCVPGDLRQTAPGASDPDRWRPRARARRGCRRHPGSGARQRADRRSGRAADGRGWGGSRSGVYRASGSPATGRRG